LSAVAGGYFERFVSGLSADRFLLSWEMFLDVAALQAKIATLRRRNRAGRHSASHYRSAFAEYDKIVGKQFSFVELEQAAPQCAMFVLALGPVTKQLDVRMNEDQGPVCENTRAARGTVRSNPSVT
jgi:hypothetical protein